MTAAPMPIKSPSGDISFRKAYAESINFRIPGQRLNAQTAPVLKRVFAPRAVIAWGVCCSEEPNMGAAIFLAILVAIFTAIFLLFILSGKDWRAAQDRARARRMAEHRMNARLLRLNI